MITIFIETLLKKLRERQDVIINTLATNAVKDMEQYRLLNGKLQGLEDGIVLVSDVYKSIVETRTLIDIKKE